MRLVVLKIETSFGGKNIYLLSQPDGCLSRGPAVWRAGDYFGMEK